MTNSAKHTASLSLTLAGLSFEAACATPHRESLSPVDTLLL